MDLTRKMFFRLEVCEGRNEGILQKTHTRLSYILIFRLMYTHMKGLGFLVSGLQTMGDFVVGLGFLVCRPWGRQFCCIPFAN